MPGLALLVLGADLLVRGSSRLAGAAGVSPLVVGLTVVALGTSSPELAVSVRSAWTGDAGIAFGNVLGSNTFNVLLILGLSAVIVPLTVSRSLVRRDVPVMIGATLLLGALALDGRLDRLDGLALFAGAALYTGVAIRRGRRDGAEPGEGSATRRPGGILRSSLVTVAGLALLILGSNWFVEGATGLAQRFGVSELVIGLTVVAGGTSLPEVATSVAAALRGQRDIAVGNVVGSNILNILGVLGVSALVAPEGIAVPRPALEFDLPVAAAAAFACLPIFFTGARISRAEGVLFLGFYAVYLTLIVGAAVGATAATDLPTALIAFVAPLGLLTLAVSLWPRRTPE